MSDFVKKEDVLKLIDDIQDKTKFFNQAQLKLLNESVSKMNSESCFTLEDLVNKDIRGKAYELAEDFQLFDDSEKWKYKLFGRVCRKLFFYLCGEKE